MVCEMRYSAPDSVFISHRKLTARSSVNGREMVMFENTTKMSRTHAPRRYARNKAARILSTEKKDIGRVEF